MSQDRAVSGVAPPRQGGGHFIEADTNGGAVYDALVAKTARAADDLLVSCDRRAAQTYERIGVAFRLIG